MNGFTNPIVTSGAFENQLEMPRQLFRMVAMEGDEIPAYQVAERYMNVIDLPETQDKVEDFLLATMGTMPMIDDVETTHLPGNVGFDISPTAFYKVLDFGYRFLYTEKAAKRDQYGLINATIRSMAQGARDTIENYAVTKLNLGLTQVSGWDKVPMYSNNHKYLNGSGYGNILPSVGATAFAMQTYYEWLSMGIRNDSYQIILGLLEGMEIHPVAKPAWLKLVTSMTEVGQANPNVVNVFAKPIISGQDTLITTDKVRENGRLINAYDTHLQVKGHHVNLMFNKRPTLEDPYIIREPSPTMVVNMRAGMVQGHTDARRRATSSGIGGA